MRHIKENINKFKEKVATYPHLTIIAASKEQPIQNILDAEEGGITNFGENYIQEASGKIEKMSHFGCHFIGCLQSNKANLAVKMFDFIHTIHTIKLADAIEKACLKQEKTISGFIQVNIGSEPQKNGVEEKGLSELVSHIKNYCPHIKLTGLMGVPPRAEEPRPYFKRLKQLADDHSLPNLSMGMSHDWEIAAEEGATHIRIGTAIFGKRQPKQQKKGL